MNIDYMKVLITRVKERTPVYMQGWSEQEMLEDDIELLYQELHKSEEETK